MELKLPNNYVEIEENEMMYLDGGGYGINKVKFYWNFARFFLNKDMAQLYLGASVSFVLGALGAATGPFAGGVLAAAGFITLYVISKISNGIWYDVNYFNLGRANWGWQ